MVFVSSEFVTGMGSKRLQVRIKLTTVTVNPDFPLVVPLTANMAVSIEVPVVGPEITPFLR